MKYHFIPIRFLKKLKTVRTPDAGEDLEKLECSDTPGGSASCYHDLGSSGDTIQFKASSM